MGQLVDIFVIKIKPEFEDADFEKIFERIPDGYKAMFSALWNEFQSLEEIMDERHLDLTVTIAREFENDECDIFFVRRYRHNSLYQIIRRTFFDTVLIIQNQFDERKLNKCVVLDKSDSFKIVFTLTYSFKNELVLNSNDIISEAQWDSEIPEDQKFVQASISNFEEEGFTVKKFDKERDDE